ncbi:MAG TPA: hypothetical protein VGA99_05615 [bacterium]
MTPVARFNRWVLTFAILFSASYAFSQRSKPIFMAINDELRYFVESTQKHHTQRLAQFDINESVLKAALLFDALGAYGISYEPWRDPLILFSKIVGYDSVYVNPPLKVFSNRRAGVEELAVIYAGVLEAAGIPSAILPDAQQTMVLFNTGIHKRYAGAVSRDITAYLIKNQQVWLPVNIKLMGKSFQEAWGRITGASRDKLYDIIPVRVLIKTKDIATARIFGSNLSKTKLDKLFAQDKSFFENDETERKWTRVETLREEDHKLAMIHFNRGVQYMSSGQQDAAITEFQRAAAFGADPNQTLFYIAKSYGEKKDYESMKEIGLQIIEQQKRDPRGYQVLGLAYYYSGDSTASKKLLQRAKFLENNSLTAALEN